jgi:hypothetical protein
VQSVVKNRNGGTPAPALLKPLSSGIIMVCLNPAGLFRNKGNEVSVNDPTGALWRAQTTVLSRSGDREGAGAQWASSGSGGHVQSTDESCDGRLEAGAHHVLGFEGRAVLGAHDEAAGDAYTGGGNECASDACTGRVVQFSSSNCRFPPSVPLGVGMIILFGD